MLYAYSFYLVVANGCESKFILTYYAKTHQLEQLKPNPNQKATFLESHQTRNVIKQNKRQTNNTGLKEVPVLDHKGSYLISLKGKKYWNQLLKFM